MVFLSYKGDGLIINAGCETSVLVSLLIIAMKIIVNCNLKFEGTSCELRHLTFLLTLLG